MSVLHQPDLRGNGGDDEGDSYSDSGLSFPTWAPSEASGFPGDPTFSGDPGDDYRASQEILQKPTWGLGECSAGSWGDESHGSGGSDKGKGKFEGKGKDKGKGPGTGPMGAFGVLTANWGGAWAEPDLHAHMKKDLKSSACQFLVIQEAAPDMLEFLNADPAPVPASNGTARTPKKFIGVAGFDAGDTTMIFARASLVKGIRLLVYHRTADGPYTVSKSKGRLKTKSTKMAVSRIMIASAKMRFWENRGSGEDGFGDQDADEFRLANVHLHFRTAKRDLQGGGAAYKRFWDVLARHLAEFRPAVLCGDFNMALFAVVPELRARGFQINLAAWYCWQQEYEIKVRADSCGIFRLGPLSGVRLCYGISAFGKEEQPLHESCRMVMQTYYREEDHKEAKRPYPITNIPFMGQGFPLDSYHPRVPSRREQCVKWTFTPVLDESESAVAEVLRCAKDDRAMFPFGIDTSIGTESWKWPFLPVSRQKPADFERFDPQRVFFRRGAHMPLMIFVGGSGDVRRSSEAVARRAAKADARGWNYERRHGMASRTGAARGKGEGRQHTKGDDAHSVVSAASSGSRIGLGVFVPERRQWQGWQGANWNWSGSWEFSGEPWAGPRWWASRD